MPDGRLPLGADELRLYVAFPEAVDETMLGRYPALLSEPELQQWQRFHFEVHRRLYLVSHALTRTVLAAHLGRQPQSLCFSVNHYGRPDLVTHAGEPDLRFNLSHTAGCALCGVVLGRDLGVDVEDTHRRGETVSIADEFFAPSEVCELRGQPVARQQDRFFDYWTLKEAYIKARGMGLSIPLDQFAYALDASPPTLSVDPRQADDAASWQWGLCSPTARHRAAFVVRRGVGPALNIVLREVVPLAE